ncbi:MULTISPECIES: heme/hemin ABC transporter substrate-binding protein [unclassified Thalassolituus]|mgnify:CR=1 FL=1|uniref:heme/hemin ABC transporter substrate-binding protein n=1 Tax=unclassified Thalassolituus TaxID=2624967 RepID=UPI0025DEDA48|nr:MULTISPECIES: ABC transporter substrate-binding protein [unclassified Thalassolituus]|tara:strand:+ start:2606 stop:3439 length:834 start_codon:yes stop_codon:yes gene_type:complete
MKAFLSVLLSLLILPAFAQQSDTGVTADVVSIDGALTEIIYQLGAEQRLAAVDTTSVYPEAATQLPQVGYMRQLSAEGILSVKPSLVIASRDAGPESVFEQIQAAGVRVVRIKTADSVDGVAEKIRQVADALNMSAQGDALAVQVTAQSQQVLAQLPADKQPATLFLLGAGGRGLMAAGQGTRADALLSLLGARNVLNYAGYKPVSAEGAVQAAPDFVLVGHTGAEQSDSVKTTLAMTPAAQNDAVHGVDVGMMLSFGPRLPQALEQAAALIYPQAD